jgi:hypothetical protein
MKLPGARVIGIDFMGRVWPKPRTLSTLGVREHTARRFDLLDEMLPERHHPPGFHSRGLF